MPRLIDIGTVDFDEDIINVLRDDDIVLFERKQKFHSTVINNKKILLSDWLNNFSDCIHRSDFSSVIRDDLVYFLYERESNLPFSLSRFQNKLIDKVHNLASQLDFYNINEIVFNTTPHNLSTYLLYKVAIETGRVVVWSNINLLESRYSIRKTTSNKIEYVIPKNNKTKLSKKETVWLEDRSKKYTLHDWEVARKKSMRGSYYNFWVDLLKWYRRLDLVFWKYKIYKTYKAKTGDFKLPNNYILFPLHYQPERTTLPEGGSFHNQMYALRLLLESLPKGMVVVAKEHPSTFSNMCHWKYRWPNYYINDKNLVWAPIETDTGMLIKHSEVVASINGSVGFEAMLLKKKVVFFAHNIFQKFENVYYYRNLHSLRDFLALPDNIEPFKNQVIEEHLHYSSESSGLGINSEVYRSFYLNYLS